MKKLILPIIMVLLTFGLVAQRQLDIQGTAHSSDTVATIKVNYNGKQDVVGLGVISQPDSLFGIGGYFKGGLLGISGEGLISAGVFGKSRSGNGISGNSTSGYGVYGHSARSTGVQGESDTTYGVFGFGKRAGIYGKSTDGVGVLGNSDHLVGVWGTSLSSVIYSDEAFTAGIFGAGDTLGIYGTTYEFKGRALKGVARSTNSIGVMGIASLLNSTGIWGDGATGGFFRGSQGTAIQLGGAYSNYSNSEEGADDCVIRSQKNQIHGDFILVTNDEMAIRLDDDDNSTSHFKVFNGDSVQIFSLDEGGNLTIAGTYSPSSDINRKENIKAIDSQEILEKLASLPIKEWQFKGEAARHIGPMAQDVYDIFGLGQNRTTIATVDADGIAMAAIQAQLNLIHQLQKQNQALYDEIQSIRKQLKEMHDLESRLEKMEIETRIRKNHEQSLRKHEK